ncbi:MAG: DUF5004 domain-containing protein [Bacteroidota bacterium]|nr:DUF5004 domain-containing protein [Bacteroidota bacterium]
MKKDNIKKFLCACLGLCAFLFTSCQKDIATIAESTKNVVGSWKIVQLTRNGEDMTTRLDISKFRIIFNADNTYTLQDQFSFLVTNPGTYSFDDPQYPFFMKFLPQNSTSESKVNFDYPIVNGQRQIRLKFSPGCSKNAYEYYFEKAQ